MSPGSTLRLFVVSGLAVLLLARPAPAYKRLVEANDALARSTFGLVASLGSYSPKASPSSGSLLSSFGLRYLHPDCDDATFHSLGAELTLNTFASGSEDVFIVDAGVLRLFPRTSVFTFDHHFFWGGGVGQGAVTRSGAAKVTVPVGYLVAGVQGRVRDWYLEARAKIYMGQSRSTFDLSGVVPQLVGIYHFNP